MQNMQVRTFRLGTGNHNDPLPGAVVVGCVNEIAAMLAGEEWSDAPLCVDDSCRCLGLIYNDSYGLFDDDQIEAQRAVDKQLQADEYAQQLPYRLAGSASEQHRIARGYMLAEFILHCHFNMIASINSEDDIVKAMTALKAINDANSDEPIEKEFMSYTALQDIVDGLPYVATMIVIEEYSYDETDRPIIRHYLDKMLALTEKTEPVHRPSKLAARSNSV